MHPGFFYQWKRGRAHGGGDAHAEGGQHCGGRSGGHRGGRGGGGWAGGRGFGVRRPLRYMADRLDLDEEQVAKLAAILDDLKTERAQASVNEQRSVSAVAQAMNGDTFDAEAASKGLELRVESARRLKEQILEALERTHAMLDKDQRERLAYLLRSGQLSI